MNHQQNQVVMWKYYLKLAYRNLYKKKLLSIVNISGLAVAMACSIFTVLFIKDELSFEAFQNNAPKIYRVAGQYEHGSSEGKSPNALTNYQLGSLLKNDFPQIKEVVRLHTFEGLVQFNGDKYFEKKMCFADHSFFRVFTFELNSGNSNHLLQKPNTVVITESIAKKYFKSQNPLGQIIESEGQLYEVTGVMRSASDNTHLNFDLMFSMETAKDVFPTAARINLSSIYVYTYFLLGAEDNASLIEAKMPEFVSNHFAKHVGTQVEFFLQPLLDIHLHSNISNEIQANGDIKYVYVFAGLALLLMIIACINYVNLTTAFSFFRFKEVGISKVLGGHRGHLVIQLLGESVLTSLLSLSVSLILVISLLPFFNELSEKSIQLDVFNELDILLGSIVFSIMVGVMAGIYPTLVITSLSPVVSLKGAKHFHIQNRSLSLKDVLVTLQFTISIAIVVSTLLIRNQLSFMITSDLGLSPDNTLVVPIHNKEFIEKYSTFKDELAKYINVKAISASSEPLTEPLVSWRQYFIQGVNDNTDEINLHTLIVDYDFFKVLGTPIMEGRDFSKEFVTDPQAAYIINEQVIKTLKIDSAVGKDIFGITYTDNGGSYYKQAKIIGVVSNFHNESLRSSLEPMVFSLVSDLDVPVKTMYIKVSSANMNSTIDAIKNLWTKFESKYDFDYSFLDDKYARLYKPEERLLNVFMLLSAVAIFVACIGVFGLSSLLTFQRTKEIGIRKVMGASTTNILALLCGNLLKLILIAFIISIPLAYAGVSKWLQNFAYTTTIEIVPFLIGGSLVLTITILTLCHQLISISGINPSKTLKNE